MRDLSGRRLLVTRSEEDAPAWIEALRSRGAIPIPYPCLAAEALPDAGPRLAAAAPSADWIAFTSARAAELAAELLAGTELRARLAAVGRATARACERGFGRVDLVGEGGAASLGRELARAVGTAHGAGTARGARVLFPCAEEALPDLETGLEGAGFQVERLPLYRTIAARPPGGPEDLSGLRLDAILLASPSAARGLAARARVPRAIPLLAIGPATAAEARRLGFTEVREARSPDLDAMLETCP